ncbi:Beta-glucosidase [Yersinia intermedia ATCC 29909]|nr:Beta-glucosidase [Yersinia intermedia ATCC 29909]
MIPEEAFFTLTRQLFPMFDINKAILFLEAIQPTEQIDK